MNVKQKLLGAAIALTLGMSGTANAFSLTYGSNTLNGITGFDWLPGSALGVNSLPLPQIGNDPNNPITIPFTVYSQAILSSFLGVNTGLTDGYALTYVAGFGELGTLTNLIPSGPFASASAQFLFDTNSTVNFFEVYLTTTAAINELAGTGYTSGVKIMTGEIVNDNGAGQSTGGDFNTKLTSPVALDQYQGDSWSGKKTYTGSGSNKAVIQLLSVDTNYLKGVDMTALTTLTILDSLATTPFNQSNPSHLVAGQSENLATINGDLSCLGAPNGTPCDFLFQNDGSQTIASIPEPDMIALLGIGLLGMGAAARRKSA